MKLHTIKAFGLMAALVMFVSLPLGIKAQSTRIEVAGSAAIKEAPTVNARSGVIIDATTGTLLYAKNPDISLPPASLTKLVTLHLVYDEIAAGRLSPDELIEIDSRDCSPIVPYGSSIMYLHPGMKVSLRDLMLGAAVVSGNDAAYALARRVSGSNEEFATLMNKAVQEMGFDKMTFVEPSGLSEFNLVTARQFALFCKKYLELHPQAIAELHSVKSMEFPREEHSAPGFVSDGRIIQYNRNPLINSYKGADGLKTGYIIEVGFNMAATALRDGTRYIAVTLGGTGSSYAGGGRQRTLDTTRLLDWAFENFSTVSLDPGPLPAPRTWFGTQRRVELIPASVNAVTAPRSQIDSVKIRVEAASYAKAPLAKGTKLGRLVYSIAGRDVSAIDLVASTDVPRGNIFRRVWDGILRFFTNIFSGKA
ncbi:MAG: D-alanyl-D-alanine carboxypeptidase family protein [Rectinemataceae bacterium]